jgi:tRNA (cytidine/uridine-2'-O-)-methyltransferase
MVDLVLFQPDIPQNTGTILRLAACMNVTAHVVEPAGFPLSDHALKRAGMDYLERVAMHTHVSFEAFENWRRAQSRRLVLLTTKAETRCHDFDFQDRDLLMLGRESSGVPQAVHDGVDARISIPLAQGMRSLNVAVAAAMALGEALRQTASFPA